MSVTIVTPGRMPGPQKLRGGCNHCGCIVDCTTDDIDIALLEQGKGRVVKCPTKGCGRNISVTEIALFLQNKLDKEIQQEKDRLIRRIRESTQPTL